MKVISIGTDRNIFVEGSAVRARQIEYGKLFEELHIIVFAKRSAKLPRKIALSEKVFAYPTRSFCKLSYVRDAARIGGQILEAEKNLIRKDWRITVQDPFECANVGLKLKRLYGIRLQVQVHTDFLNPYFRRQSILNFIRSFSAPYALRHADRIRVVSLRIADSITSRYSISRDAIDVFPIAVDVQRISEALATKVLREKYPQFDSVVLMLSRLEKEKDVSTALRAFSLLLKNSPRAGLVIAGSGREESKLRNLASDLGISASVIFESWVADPLQYLKSADVLLHTSHYEGYGLALAEAAAAGLPIVTTDVGIVGSVLIHEKSALVCPPGDARCLGNGLSRLIANPTLKGSLAERAKDSICGTVPEKTEAFEMYRKLLE